MSALPDKCLAAMVAVAPLPGSPLYGGDPDAVVEQALADVAQYQAAGVDAVVLENSHDLPYVKPPLDPEGVETMRRVALAVRQCFAGPIGLQMLEAANLTALEIAHDADLNFIRVESYVFAHVGGAGLIEGCAGAVLRRREELGCAHIRVFGDVKKKHCSHALTGDQDIVDEAKQAAFFLADGLVVTGARTGEEPDVEDVRRVRDATELPVWIGSGMTPENVKTYYPEANGFIVGSTFREDGNFMNRLDPRRLDHFMTALGHLAS